jgi:hypothetical protein
LVRHRHRARRRVGQPLFLHRVPSTSHRQPLHGVVVALARRSLARHCWNYLRVFGCGAVFGRGGKPHEGRTNSAEFVPSSAGSIPWSAGTPCRFFGGVAASESTRGEGASPTVEWVGLEEGEGQESIGSPHVVTHVGASTDAQPDQDSEAESSRNRPSGVTRRSPRQLNGKRGRGIERCFC